MKRLALLLFLVWLGVPVACRADDGVVELFKAAKTAVASHQFDDALCLCERLIVEHPESTVYCFQAQSTIATTLAAKGDFAEAAKAAHLAMDCAPTEAAFDSAVLVAANILSALDQNVERANQLLAFQQTGPANGGVNPLGKIGYPALPERERAFVAVREQAGDSVAASRLRASTFLLTGNPREAFAQFADAFRRSVNLRDIQSAGTDLASIGLRAVRGHRLDQNKGFQFVVFGPNTPGGKADTADNPGNPFAGILPAPPTLGEGGLALLGTEDLAALRHLRDATTLYVGDAWVDLRTRRLAIGALQRTNEALDGWGCPGQKEWYLKLAFESGAPFQTDAPWLGAQAAAKGRDLHLAGITALWSEIDVYCAAHGIEFTPVMTNARKQFTAIAAGLSSRQFAPPQPKYLKKPAAF